jgi:hypothetical protein
VLGQERRPTSVDSQQLVKNSLRSRFGGLNVSATALTCPYTRCGRRGPCVGGGPAAAGAAAPRPRLEGSRPHPQWVISARAHADGVSLVQRQGRLPNTPGLCHRSGGPVRRHLLAHRPATGKRPSQPAAAVPAAGAGTWANLRRVFVSYALRADALISSGVHDVPEAAPPT